MKKGLWIYRAYDEYNLPVAESYRKSDLVAKLRDEFPLDDINKKFTIKRIFENWLQ